MSPYSQNTVVSLSNILLWWWKVYDREEVGGRRLYYTLQWKLALTGWRQVQQQQLNSDVFQEPNVLKSYNGVVGGQHRVH